VGEIESGNKRKENGREKETIGERKRQS